MKYLILLFITLFPTAVFAIEHEPEPVKEDAFLVQKQINTWRTEQVTDPRVRVYACQAVRLSAEWFVTSAHCVYTACRNKDCTVQIDLVDAELSASARVYHSTANQSVFIYDGFFPGQNRISGVDTALIRMHPEKTDFSFTDNTTGERIDRKTFEQKLAYYPESKAQWKAYGVRLLDSALAKTSLLKMGIVVPKVSNGVISYLQNGSDVFFVEDMRYFISPSFGVRAGNSGGGVFTRQGDLVGIVSAMMYAKDGSASFTDEQGNKKLTLQNARAYFFFTGFNSSTLGFIRNRISGVRTISLIPLFATPVDKNFDAIIKQIEGTPISF